MAVNRDMSLCFRSVLITFTFHVTKQHPVNISFLKKQAPKLVLLFCSAIKHGYRWFIS